MKTFNSRTYFGGTKCFAHLTNSANGLLYTISKLRMRSTVCSVQYTAATGTELTFLFFDQYYSYRSDENGNVVRLDLSSSRNQYLVSSHISFKWFKTTGVKYIDMCSH